MESTATTASHKVEEIKAIEPATLNEIAGSYSVPSRTTSNVTGSEAEAKAFIYQKESGNEPCKYNNGTPTGGVDCNYKGDRACGIGQSLPCSKLRNACSLSDYACQDAWFTNYMLGKYGSWQKAKEFWLCKGKCTNKYATIDKTSTWW